MGRPARNPIRGRERTKDSATPSFIGEAVRVQETAPAARRTDEDRFAYDAACRDGGARCLAGIDEAGRGPLAGPVVAAAVILPAERPAGLEGLNDSKQVAPAVRERLYDVIVESAVSWGVAIVEAEVIDRINILQATWQAMREAIRKLGRPCDLLLVDGSPVKGLPFPQRNVIKGDSASASIAAASILAKVTRDRIMRMIDPVYPQYGFASHKGYCCPFHLAALEIFGPSDYHRKSFLPVQETLFSSFHSPPGPAFQSLLKSLVPAGDKGAFAEIRTFYVQRRAELSPVEAWYFEESLRKAEQQLSAPGEGA